MRNRIIDQVEHEHAKRELPSFAVGDTVDVSTRIVEGDKERLQTFSGTVIMRKGAGMNEMFTVRRIVNNEGVERIFPLHSPFIANIIVRRSGQTRRAKLFYLRQRVGKAVRLTEERKVKKESTEPAASAPAPAPERAALAGSAT